VVKKPTTKHLLGRSGRRWKENINKGFWEAMRTRNETGSGSCPMAGFGS